MGQSAGIRHTGILSTTTFSRKEDYIKQYYPVVKHRGKPVGRKGCRAPHEKNTLRGTFGEYHVQTVFFSRMSTEALFEWQPVY